MAGQLDSTLSRRFEARRFNRVDQLRSPPALRSDKVLRREQHRQVVRIFLGVKPARKLVVRKYRQHAVVDPNFLCQSMVPQRLRGRCGPSRRCSSCDCALFRHDRCSVQHRQRLAKGSFRAKPIIKGIRLALNAYTADRKRHVDDAKPLGPRTGRRTQLPSTLTDDIVEVADCPSNKKRHRPP